MKPGADIENDVPTVEPPLQHKKRVDGPPTSLSTEYFSLPPDAPEYTLLGQQEKFAHNVKYHGKKTAPDGLYKNKENFDSPPPPSKQLKMQKRIKPLIKERHPPVTRSSHYLADTKSPLSPPPAPRELKDNVAVKEAMKDKDLRDVLGEKPAVTKAKEQVMHVTKNGKLREDSNKKLESEQMNKRKSKIASTVHDVEAEKNVRNVTRDRPAVVRSEDQQPHRTQTRTKKDDIFTMNEFVQTDKQKDDVFTMNEFVQTDKQKDDIFTMNEFVQTNMKKGVAVSGPEAPADYALRYKAKVARPLLAKQVSEYQKQFQWKDTMKTSPLLGAEEIVFKSKTDLGPYKKDGVPRMSEYRYNFHPWKPEAFPSDVNLNNNKNNNNNSNNNSRDSKAERQRKFMAKRSRSTGAVPDHDESAHVRDQQDVESASNELKSKLKKAYGKSRRMTSEYQANYKSPTNYKYENGIWKGAYPPQLAPDFANGEEIEDINANNNNNNNNNADSSAASNWFAEVIELRRRAEEYRKRAQGTHFSREHLVQLLAKQNECWDVDAEASSTIKALNLEKPAIRTGHSKKLRETGSLKHQPGSRESSPGLSDVDEIFQETETPEESEQMKKLQKGRKYGQNRKSRKMAWLEEQKEKIAQQKRRLEKGAATLEHDGVDRVATEKFEGRLPTPVLQKSFSPIRRHHLDLTTPSVGGAILTCPPTRENKMVVTTRTGHSYVTASDDYPVRALQQTYNFDKLRTMPIYGRPSDDTHYLRNDSAIDSDKPLKTQYVASPPLYDSDDDKENQESQHDQRQPKHSKKNLRPGDLTAVPEGYGRTYNLSQPFLNLDDIKSNSNRKDDDVMSVSLMSVASSSSLASDVLERTKKRQDFWNKTTQKDIH